MVVLFQNQLHMIYIPNPDTDVIGKFRNHPQVHIYMTMVTLNFLKKVDTYKKESFE